MVSKVVQNVKEKDARKPQIDMYLEMLTGLHQQQQYELLKKKKVKLTEKLLRFFKVLEQRVEEQPMDAAQMKEGKR